MSYSDITPAYYRMFQPDSPWHAGSPGWRDAPVPGWGRNPLLAGPPQVATSGLGAYYASKFETPISGLGATGCGCRGVGADAAAAPVATSTGLSTNTKGALLIGGAAVVLMALVGIPGIWDDA